MLGFYSRRNKLGSTLGYSMGIYSQKLGWGWSMKFQSSHGINLTGFFLKKGQAQGTQAGGW